MRMQVSTQGDHSSRCWVTIQDTSWKVYNIHLVLVQVGSQGASQLLGVDIEPIGQALLILEQAIEQLLQLLWGDTLRHI